MSPTTSFRIDDILKCSKDRQDYRGSNSTFVPSSGVFLPYARAKKHEEYKAPDSGLPRHRDLLDDKCTRNGLVDGYGIVGDRLGLHQPYYDPYGHIYGNDFNAHIPVIPTSYLGYGIGAYSNLGYSPYFRPLALNTLAKRKGGQVRFTPQQTQNLERRFDAHKYLSPEDRRILAGQLKLSDRQVKTWFQNRRAKWRRANNASANDCEDLESDNQSEEDLSPIKRTANLYEDEKSMFIGR